MHFIQNFHSVVKMHLVTKGEGQLPNMPLIHLIIISFLEMHPVT